MFNDNIQTFIKVANLGSFSKASDELFLSRVSVMNQINNLETELEVKLFNRSSRGVTLTKAGSSFYKGIKEIINKGNDLKRKIKETEKNNSKTIKKGTSIMRPCNAFLEIFENITKKVNDEKFQFQIVSFNDYDGLNNMFNALGKSIDCFLTPMGMYCIPEEYNFFYLGESKCAIALSKTHPLSKKTLLNWNDLDEEIILLLKEGDSYILDNLRKEIQNKHPLIKIEDYNQLYDFNSFNLCEESGYLMETLDLWSDLHPLLKTIPVNWNYSIPYGLVYSKNCSKMIEEFINTIKRYNLKYPFI